MMCLFSFQKHRQTRRCEKHPLITYHFHNVRTPKKSQTTRVAYHSPKEFQPLVGIVVNTFNLHNAKGVWILTPLNNKAKSFTGLQHF